MSVPKNWVETNLDTILERISNGSSLKQYDEYLSGLLPITRIETIANENIDLSRVKYVKPEEKDIERFKLIRGDILFSHINSDKHLGKTAHFDLDELVIHGINLLLMRSISLYNSKLLNYLLKYYRSGGKFIEVAQRAVNQSSINQKKLKEFPVLLPPLPEQERIVAKLDALFGQLEVIKVSLARIPQLIADFKQQVLTQAVTGKLTEDWRDGKELEEWKKYTLADLLMESPKNGAYYPKNKYGKGTRIIRIDSFYDGELKYWDRVQKVEITEKDFSTYRVDEGNILINRVNSIQYLGKCMLAKDLREPCIYESNMMKLVINNYMISSEFLKTFLVSPLGLKELRKNAKHAVNQASINQTDVKNVELKLPSENEQQEIVNRVESLFTKADTIEAQYQTLKEKIDSLPQAILHKAFKGELVAQLPTDGSAADLLQQIKELKTTTKSKKSTTKPYTTTKEQPLQNVAEGEGEYGKDTRK